MSSLPIHKLKGAKVLNARVTKSASAYLKRGECGNYPGLNFERRKPKLKPDPLKPVFW
jgi:hypothetical protein